MESSFFEYRDETGVEVDSDSDTDIIEESVLDELLPKTPMRNDHTVVPDSEESLVYDELDEEKDTPHAPTTVVRRSVAEARVICSSDDDVSKQASRHSENRSCQDTVSSGSSDEEEVSPEMVPKRRPPARLKSLNSTTESPILRRVKKRMVLLDSDTDNSLIIERNKNSKMKCLKDTPLKIDSGKSVKVNDSEEEVETDASHDESGSEDDESVAVDDESEAMDDEASENNENADKTDEDGPDEDQMVMSRATRMSIMGIIPKQNESDESDFIESDDSVKPSIAGSTESLTELPEVVLPNRTPLKVKTPEKHVTQEVETVEDSEMNDSVLTCSPIQSPKRDDSKHDNSVSESPVLSNKFTEKNIRNALKEKVLNNLRGSDVSNKKETKYYDGEVTVIEDGIKDKPIKRANAIKNKSNSYYDGEVTVVEDLKDKVAVSEGNKENSEESQDDDVTLIDKAPEVIMLSSDEEDRKIPLKKSSNNKTSAKSKLDLQSSQKSAKTKTSNPEVVLQIEPKKTSQPKTESRKDNNIRQYLPPPSYPNQVVYVQKHVLDNELSKLNAMKEDLHNIRHLLDNMDVSTLPDGGSKLISRLTDLEAAVRRQGDRVGNMVVEPSQPGPADVARDGFDRGLSWSDLQQASNAVQPRMFGKQAMSTHLAERNLILERLRDLHESLGSRPPEEKQAQPPAALKTELMPHQKHALAWLQWRETQKPMGGILADDMGLGKTITMIALVASDREIRDDDESDEDEERPKGKYTKCGTLVVCPASLMTQWAGEVKKHCLPHRISTCLHHGAARATQPQRLASYDVVLTTYNILQRDSEKDGVLMRVRWRRAILDEAHSVRNHKSATSRAVSALRARRRWALTGTPLHNKDLDLFALLKFLRCSPFDDLAMWKKWIDNKSQGGQERLSTVMRCIMLRRTKVQLQAKGQLKDLPSRTAHQKHVTLTKDEMNVYQKVLVFSKTLFAQFLHQRAEKNGDVGFLPNKKDSAYDDMHKKMIALQGAKPVKSHEILVLLLRLRQVCCHCGLIAAMLDEDDTGAIEEDEGGKDLLAELNKLTLEDSKAKSDENETESEQVHVPEQEGTTAAEAIRSVLSPNNPVFDLARRSSKIRAVMDCLKENVLSKKGEKAVVVSQWTSVLRLVEQELRLERVESVTLSGSVPVPARAALVAALNDGRSAVRIMLLSLCAGGVGLNLCGASHLLLLDPHWNPQLEEQAQDRVYRVGQTRPVHIYRFMCVDTVEQSIRKLQEAKLEMAASVLTGARHTAASKLSIEDLKVLFNMGQ